MLGAFHKQLFDFGDTEYCNTNLEWYKVIYSLFINWDSPHPRLSNHYKAWSYIKNKQKKIYRKAYRKSV